MLRFFFILCVCKNTVVGYLMELKDWLNVKSCYFYMVDEICF